MLNQKRLELMIEGLQNLYTWVRFPPAPPSLFRPVLSFSYRRNRTPETVHNTLGHELWTKLASM